MSWLLHFFFSHQSVLQGYIVVPDFFSAAELDPCKEAVNGLVDELANNLYKAGKIKGKAFH